MVSNNISYCSKCGGELKHYDRVKRIVRSKGGVKKETKIERLRCTKCGEIHRNLPEYMYPYKQYEVEIIKGVADGSITPDTTGFEDYPCEVTMHRWTRK